MGWGKSFLLITVLLFSRGGFSAGFQDLLNQHLRPSIRQVMDLLDQGILPSDISGQPEIKVQEAVVLQDLPKIIATIEHFFPGATWAPLGRDAFLMGDWLDAFYESIGQTGRVSRMNCSGSSFSGATQETLVKFLESAGLDLQNADTAPPFVLFDHTSMGGGSQSTRLITAGYHAFKLMGRDPVDLLRKFHLWTSDGGIAAEQTNPDTFFDPSWVAQHGRPSKPLSLPFARPFMYAAEWHADYQPFYENEEGKTVGRPGAMGSVQVRSSILLGLVNVIELVSRPAFLARVQEEALKLGYQFPMKRQYEVVTLSREERAKLAAERKEAHQRQLAESLKANLEQISGELGPVANQTGYLSPNGLRLYDWLNSTSPSEARNALGLLFIGKLVSLRTEGKIGDRDFRRLTARAVGTFTIPDDELVRRFSELYKSAPLLQEVLSARRDVFVQSKRPDAAAVLKNYQYLETQLHQTCAIELLRPEDKNKQPEEAA